MEVESSGYPQQCRFEVPVLQLLEMSQEPTQAHPVQRFSSGLDLEHFARYRVNHFGGGSRAGEIGTSQREYLAQFQSVLTGYDVAQTVFHGSEIAHFLR